MADPNTKADAMMRWLHDTGFKPNKNLVFTYSKSFGYYVTTKGDMKKGEALFAIPKKMVLSPENSSLSLQLSKKNRGQFDKLDSWNKLVLCLIHENSMPMSAWRPYLDVLPEKLGTPLFWGSKELEYLKGTDIEERIGMEVITQTFKSVILPFIKSNPVAFGRRSGTKKDTLTDDDYFNIYRRFGSIIMAYSFTKPNLDVVMMPMADMLNHKTGFNNARLFIDKEEEEEEEDSEDEFIEPEFYIMKTIKAVPSGSQLFNTYGKLSNSELLRKYGFVERDRMNEHDLVELPYSLFVDVISKFNLPNIEERQEFLFKYGIIEEENLEDLSFELLYPKLQQEETQSDSKQGNTPTVLLDHLNHTLSFLLTAFTSTEEEFEQWKKMFNENEDKMLQSGGDDDDEVPNQRKKKKSGNDEDDDDDDDDDDDEEEIQLVDLKDYTLFKNILRKLLKSRLSRYQTTLKQDKDNLKKLANEINENVKNGVKNDEVENILNAIIVNISEKRILKKYLKLI
eukprot:TRINITY_DN636_c5_g1_i1.p1 TRINITY_DN636_c5_g1~~TRINITY_DN636_c5_g1_i1.p1  ORF type:complete len:510 (-),score=153.80 TRINITY_DN636_c5_g1_i1:73-1602(-)